MKISRLLISSIILLSLIVPSVYSQQPDSNVQIITTGIGNTENEAIDDALRIAVKRVCGIYTSEARVLNDDDLVTNVQTMITQGTIQRHEVLSKSQQEGKVHVTVSSIVSGPKLVAYVQSKGNTVPFSGASFGMNIKLKEMNKQNEILEVEQMVNRLENIHNFFNFELSLSDLSFFEDDRNFYVCKGTVLAITNSNAKLYNDIIYNTLDALCLSESEQTEYAGLNIKMYPLTIGNRTFYLRQNHTTLLSNKKIRKTFDICLDRFVIRNNLNDELTTLSSGNLEANGQVFYNESITRKQKPQLQWDEWQVSYIASTIHEENVCYATRSFRLLIPVSDIQLYSEFKVEPILEKSAVNKERGIYIGEDRYVGELANGEPNGRGVKYYHSPSNILTVEGMWKNGAPHGQCIVRFSNGNVYEGQVVNGRLYGQGKYYNVSNKYCIPMYKSKRAADPNVEINLYYNFMYKGVYVGEFKDGYFDGYGIVYGDQKLETILYKGYFKDGMRHGQGTFYYENGDIFVGEWAYGVYRKGTYTYYDKEIYKEGRKESRPYHESNDANIEYSYAENYHRKYGCTKIWEYKINEDGWRWKMYFGSDTNKIYLDVVPTKESYTVPRTPYSDNTKEIVTSLGPIYPEDM